MKNLLKQTALWALMLALATGFAGCNKDDDGGNTNIDEIPDDGLYIKGTAAPATLPECLFGTATNEAESNSFREGMYEIYVVLNQGEFKLYKVSAGKAGAELGGTPKYTYNGSGVAYQITSPASYYTTSESGAAISVNASGLYHIIYDETLSTAVVIKVAGWELAAGLSGALTPNASFTEYSITGRNIKADAGAFKVRHSGGWKIGVSDTVEAAAVKVNTNFGGAINALVAGGADMPPFAEGEAEAKQGAYNITLAFTPGNQPSKRFALSLVRTGDLVLNSAGQATFRVTVPEMVGKSNTIAVAGNFEENAWTGTGHEMTQESEGVYTLTATVPAGFEYKYVISNYAGNGWVWENSGNREMPLSLQANDVVASWGGDPFTPPVYPETLYMIGEVFGGWDWASDGVVTMTKQSDGVFTWTGNLTANSGFKWCAAKAWDGSFNGLGTNVGYTLDNGNALVAEDGNYTITVDYTTNTITIVKN
jgi:hypothetical protein